MFYQCSTQIVLKLNISVVLTILLKNSRFHETRSIYNYFETFSEFYEFFSSTLLLLVKYYILGKDWILEIFY